MLVHVFTGAVTAAPIPSIEGAKFVTFTERLDAHVELLQTILVDLSEVLTERFDGVTITVNVTASLSRDSAASIR